LENVELQVFVEETRDFSLLNTSLQAKTVSLTDAQELLMMSAGLLMHLELNLFVIIILYSGPLLLNY
jgi:hypothetical protein